MHGAYLNHTAAIRQCDATQHCVVYRRCFASHCVVYILYDTTVSCIVQYRPPCTAARTMLVLVSRCSCAAYSRAALTILYYTRRADHARRRTRALHRRRVRGGRGAARRPWRAGIRGVRASVACSACARHPQGGLDAAPQREGEVRGAWARHPRAGAWARRAAYLSLSRPAVCRPAPSHRPALTLLHSPLDAALCDGLHAATHPSC